jgi:hypothetical protein
MEGNKMEIMEIEQKALTLPQKAGLIKVLNQETFKAACEFREGIKAVQKEIDAAFDPIITKAHQAHKEAIGQKKKAEAPLVEAKGIIEPEISRYLTEQERIRKAEEARLAEIARKAEEESRLAEAAVYEAAGDKQAADEIINEPIRTQATVLPKANLNSGINMRETWSAEVTSLKDLVQAIAEGKVPLDAVEANMTVLNAQARTLKNGFNWPGVRAVSKSTIY